MPLLLRSEEHTSELQSPCNLVCRFCLDRKSTRLNSSHLVISYAVFCLKKKNCSDNILNCSANLLHCSDNIFNWSENIWNCSDFFFFLLIRRPPRSTLFPNRTLFR